VVYLGLTSLFTDVSSEMVSTILPVYLIFFLRLTPLQFGIIDGLYQGATALVRLAGGIMADRTRRHKEVAGAGYALSAACKLGLLAAGGAWTALAAVLVLDRTGKGIRTAPRDALISLSTPRANLAMAFGVHRALDTAGALLGPLVAFGLLAWAPNAFDAVFVVSFCVALVGLGVLVLFVENQPLDRETPANRGLSFPTIGGLLATPRFRALALSGGVLGLVTMSDGFLYLGLQRRLDLGMGFFPLLYVVTALFYFLFAVPAGRLADRIGRGRTFITGYALLTLVYLALLLPSISYWQLIGLLALFGAYYAATDGVLMALASAALPPGVRSTGLAFLTTATSVARLLSSVLFGALWTWQGEQVAIILFLTGLLAALALTAVALARTQTGVEHGQAISV
jgi:MFS family permease